MVLSLLFVICVVLVMHYVLENIDIQIKERKYLEIFVNANIPTIRKGF